MVVRKKCQRQFNTDNNIICCLGEFNSIFFHERVGDVIQLGKLNAIIV